MTHARNRGFEVRSLVPSTTDFDVDDDAPIPSPPQLSDAALYGPIGDWVQMIAPHTEASRAALLASALAAIGALIGRSPFVTLDGSRHGVNLFVMLIGPTASGRKGTAVSHVMNLLRDLDDEFARRNRVNGLASGQGLINAVRDAREPLSPDKPADVGVADKRLLIVEAEFAGPLKQMQSQGNTLSTTIREAFDGGPLRTMVKGDPLIATEHHIAIVAQITPEELVKQLQDTELFNGFLNRFLPIWTERAHCLPFGSEPDPLEAQAVLERIRSFVVSARRTGCTNGLTPAARTWWAQHYAALTTGRRGRVGAATQRGAPLVRRIALLYALGDGASVVDAPHLEAAHALWQYAIGTAVHVLGGSELSALASRINGALRDAGAAGMDRTAIRKGPVGSNSTDAKAIRAALSELSEAGLARMVRDTETDGRPREVWVHIEHLRPAVPVKNGPSASDAALSSHKSLPSLVVEVASVEGPRRHAEV